MADIGIRTDSDTLVLWRGRDFKWTFENLDADGNPVNFPPGRLYFELQTGGEHDAVQRVRTLRADGGSFTLTLDGQETGPLSFDDESADLRSALEALPNVGAGNVSVSTGLYYPQWIIDVTLSGPAAPTLPRNVQGAIREAVAGVFDALEILGLGMYDFEAIYDPPNWRFVSTRRAGLTEGELITYIIDILNTSIKSVLEAIPQIGLGNVTVDETYAPIKEWTVSFHGDLGLQPIEALVGDPSNLTGSDPEVEVTVIEPGRHPLTEWDFIIEDHLATLKVESEEADQVSERTKWQLVFLPDGEPAGGDPVTRGIVQRLG